LGQAPPNSPASRVIVDNTAASGAGILSSVALLNPELLPLAAGAGIGYGIYKLGESFNFW
jgi:hypothetical protein